MLILWCCNLLPLIAHMLALYDKLIYWHHFHDALIFEGNILLWVKTTLYVPEQILNMSNGFRFFATTYSLQNLTNCMDFGNNQTSLLSNVILGLWNIMLYTCSWIVNYAANFSMPILCKTCMFYAKTYASIFTPANIIN